MREPKAIGVRSPAGAWFERLRQMVVSVRIMDSPDIRAVHSTRGVMLMVNRKGGGPGHIEVQRLRIIAGVNGVNKGDYISCEFWDGTTAEGSVNVAKPWLLRRSTLHGQTRGGETFDYEADALTRTVTHDGLSGDPESVEVLWPQYRPLDEVWAVRVSEGTGVMAGSQEVEYLDLNVDGRTFVHPYQLTTMCVGGVDRSVVVRRGDVV